jgi:hypothetical protein
MEVIINDATNIRQYAFYKAVEYQGKLNKLLELEGYDQAAQYIDELAREN